MSGEFEFQKPGWTLGSSGGGTGSHEPRGGRSRVMKIVLLLILCAGGFFGVGHFLRSYYGFPQLVAGVFIGEIRVTKPAGTARRASMLVVSSPLDGRMDLLVEQGLGGQGLNGSGRWQAYAWKGSATESSPFELSLGERRLSLFGADGWFGDPRGVVRDEAGERVGEWQLEPLPSEVVVPAELFSEWFTKRAELAQIEEDSLRLEKVLAAQKGELEQLTKLVTDDRELKRRADAKLQNGGTRVSQLKSDVAVQRAEADRLAKQLELAQRLGAKGKLVALSRESLEREMRWAVSMAVGDLGMIDGDFEQAVQRGSEVRELKDSIALEEQRVRALADQIDGAPPR